MRKESIIAAVFVIIVLSGMGIAYVHNPYGANIEADIDGNTVNYKISANYATGYSVVSIYNDKELGIEDYYVLSDAEYGSVIIGDPLESLIGYLQKELCVRGGIKLIPVDSQEMQRIMQEELSSGDFRSAVIFLSGAMPDTIYDGTVHSTAISWLSAGGTIYWSGQNFGKYIARNGGIEKVVDHSLELFGVNDAFRDVGDYPTFSRSAVNPTDNDQLCMHYNNITYGIKPNNISNQSLSLGYIEDGACSAVLLKYGEGMLVHLGGYIGHMDAYYVAQIISLYLTYSSEFVEYSEGKMIKGGVTGTVHLDRSNTSVAVYLDAVKVSKLWILRPGSDNFI